MFEDKDNPRDGEAGGVLGGELGIELVGMDLVEVDNLGSYEGGLAVVGLRRRGFEGKVVVKTGSQLQGTGSYDLHGQPVRRRQHGGSDGQSTQHCHSCSPSG